VRPGISGDELKTSRLEDSGAVDVAAIDQLVAICGEDGEAFVTSLIGTFFIDAARQLLALRLALAEGYAEEVGRAAHTLKSQAMTFGAQRLADLAREAEQLARFGHLGPIEALLGDLVAEFDRASEALRNIEQSFLTGTHLAA
jgi:HPt (histidine-containing phosphotransfer) domain-containing protein